MNYKTCSCFGHSKIEITNDLKNKINDIFEDLIVNKNFGIFLFGGFGEFDTLCHQVVTELKKKYTFIKRVYCLENPSYVKPTKRPKWLKDDDYENFVYLPLNFDYWYTRIYFRNCEMINQSDYVLFYVTNKQNSGAYKAFRFAKIKKKNYLNLAK